MIDIIEAKFIISATNIAQAPQNEEQNEVAFLARSNTGKSSLLNALTNFKNLAKISSTPGKTRLINYFDITFLNREASIKKYVKFIDLPGFGYAKVSKSMQSQWKDNLTTFISKRKQIKLFIYLIDCRHPHLQIDNEVTDFLEKFINPSQIILKVFTKIDKLNQKEQSLLIKEFPDALMCSSSKKKGLLKINNKIYNILNENEAT